MVKGVNKQIVEVINPDNELFERAIFFIKPQVKSPTSKELSQNADLLISSQKSILQNKHSKAKSTLAFLISAGIGALIAVTVSTLV
ncbi:MAG: hypothetical protein FWF76_04360 [Oscillospiraceae bacterium]|nr:hypothetical protein [Oscillospiraceae bacterium]